MTQKPQSMDEMLALSREQAMEIDDFRYGDAPSIKAVTRHMVRLLSKDLEWQGRENSQSLRGLWYSGVKQVYQNLYPERWGTDYYSESASRRFSQSLSEHTSTLVKEGVLTYRDLNIVDDSRKREVVGTDRVECDKILFVEKEAKYRQLLPIADVLGVSIVSGGGWQATALIEDLANVLDSDQSYSIFVLTDFDPTGYQIADDFRRRARTLGIDIETVERVGIEPEQIPEETLEAEKFRVPVENDTDREWLRDHGIEDDFGDPVFGLELEAIGERGSQAADFRRVVVEALEPHPDKDRRRHKDTNIETANVVGRGVDELVDDITDGLVTRLKEYAVGVVKDDPAVTSLSYRPEDDVVSAGTHLSRAEDGVGDFVPTPLLFADYTDAAIDGEDSGPRPDRGAQQRLLRDILVGEINDPDGDLDIEDLIDLDV